MKLRVALAHAFGCAPSQLRDATPLEVLAMADHLAELERMSKGR